MNSQETRAARKSVSSKAAKWCLHRTLSSDMAWKSRSVSTLATWCSQQCRNRSSRRRERSLSLFLLHSSSLCDSSKYKRHWLKVLLLFLLLSVVVHGGGQSVVGGAPMLMEHAPCRSVLFCTRSHADSQGLTVWSAVSVEEWTRATSRAATIRSAARAAEARCILRGRARLGLQQLRDPVALLLAAGPPLRTPYLPPRSAAVAQLTFPAPAAAQCTAHAARPNSRSERWRGGPVRGAAGRADDHRRHEPVLVRPCRGLGSSAAVARLCLRRWVPPRRTTTACLLCCC